MKHHIVLYEPVMPANTGNISRTIAGTDSALHLIHPLGFKTDDRMLKRAGLDYWEHVEIYEHKSLEAFCDFMQDAPRVLVTKFAHQTYSDVDYTQMGDECFFIFGSETHGLPEEFMRQEKEHTIRIPMNDEHVRSLNLSNAVAIVLYESLRQHEFEVLEKYHHYTDTPKARNLNW